MANIAIHGFGRIGRMVFRAAAKHFPDIEVVGINDLLEPDYLAYMLQYDSVHGRFPGTIAVEGSTLIVNGKRIRLTQERDPANLKWGEVGAAVVVRRAGVPQLDGAQLLEHLEGRCARYRWPRYVVFWDALPKSGYGKIVKKDIRRLLLERGEVPSLPQ